MSKALAEIIIKGQYLLKRRVLSLELMCKIKTNDYTYNFNINKLYYLIVILYFWKIWNREKLKLDKLHLIRLISSWIIYLESRYFAVSLTRPLDRNIIWMFGRVFRPRKSGKSDGWWLRCVYSWSARAGL